MIIKQTQAGISAARIRKPYTVSIDSTRALCCNWHELKSQFSGVFQWSGDSRISAEMAVQMRDSHTVDELEAAFAETLHDKQSSFFIKYINDLPVEFAQC